MLKLKLQYFGHLMRRVHSLEDSDAGRDWRQEEQGTTVDEMAGWHHRLNGRKLEWTLGDGDGQGGLACCSSWGCKESDTTEQLNWTELKRHDWWFFSWPCEDTSKRKPWANLEVCSHHAPCLPAPWCWSFQFPLFFRTVMRKTFYLCHTVYAILS